MSPTMIALVDSAAAHSAIITLVLIMLQLRQPFPGRPAAGRILKEETVTTLLLMVLRWMVGHIFP